MDEFMGLERTDETVYGDLYSYWMGMRDRGQELVEKAQEGGGE